MRCAKMSFLELARFNRRNQLETAEKYIMELCGLPESCEYDVKTAKMIRDRLVVGIKEGSNVYTATAGPDLTLEAAKRKIRQEETFWEQQSFLLKEHDSAAIEEVNHLHARWKDQRHQTSKTRRY